MSSEFQSNPENVATICPASFEFILYFSIFRYVVGFMIRQKEFVFPTVRAGWYFRELDRTYMSCRLNRGSRILFLSFLFDLYFVLFLFGLCICVCGGWGGAHHSIHVSHSSELSRSLHIFIFFFRTTIIIFFLTFCLDFFSKFIWSEKFQLVGSIILNVDSSLIKS